MKIVLYAEGSTELGSSLGLPPMPGSVLPEERLGAGHILFRRAIAHEAPTLPAAHLRFVQPLRTHQGREARGSDLLHPRTLRQLLRWARADLQPELAIVLVDADEDLQRHALLQRHTADTSLRCVLAVAVQEFEAWLIADVAAVRRCLGQDLDQEARARDPERLGRSEAKELLQRWIAGAPSAHELGSVRREIASALDLEVLAQRCRSFAQCLQEIRALRLAS